MMQLERLFSYDDWANREEVALLRRIGAPQPALRLLDILQRVDLDSTIPYRSSKGEAWSSRVEDVLMHVVIHGAYHRGQVATVIRQGAETPAYTDYIQATRSGAV